MFSPRPGLGLEAQNTGPGLGLMTAWPRGLVVFEVL